MASLYGREWPLTALPNVLLTPHTAGYSLDSLAQNRRETIDEVLRVLAGEWPTALVNPAVKARARGRTPAPA